MKEITQYLMTEWKGWMVVAITGLLSLIGLFLKKKAENLATRTDIKELTNTVKEIEASYAKAIENHKVELLKLKVLYEERLRAYSKLVGLMFEIRPDLPSPYADHEDFLHQLAKSLGTTQLKLKTYLIEYAGILPPKVRDLIVKTYSKVEDGLFEPPSEYASTRAFWANLNAADTAFREHLNLEL